MKWQKDLKKVINDELKKRCEKLWIVYLEEDCNWDLCTKIQNNKK